MRSLETDKEAIANVVEKVWEAVELQVHHSHLYPEQRVPHAPCVDDDIIAETVTPVLRNLAFPEVGHLFFNVYWHAFIC